MIYQEPIQLTHEDLRNAPPADRAAVLEAYLVASIAALRPDAPAFNQSARLADLGVDSLQVVELKFGLDQVLGQETDVALLIENPTLRELAERSLRACGL